MPQPLAAFGRSRTQTARSRTSEWTGAYTATLPCRKGDLSKAATVTFTPPDGSGLAATTWNRTGKGAEPFTFNAKGVWTVTLKFANTTTRTAHIDIQAAGLTLIFK